MAKKGRGLLLLGALIGAGAAYAYYQLKVKEDDFFDDDDFDDFDDFEDEDIVEESKDRNYVPLTKTAAETEEAVADTVEEFFDEDEPDEEVDDTPIDTSAE